VSSRPADGHHRRKPAWWPAGSGEPVDRTNRPLSLDGFDYWAIEPVINRKPTEAAGWDPDRGVIDGQDTLF
jgi:hypothetical protein